MLKMQVQARNRFEALCDLLYLNQLELSHEMMLQITEEKLQDRYYELLIETGLHPNILTLSLENIFKITHQLPVLLLKKNIDEEVIYLFMNHGYQKNTLYVYAGGIRKKQKNIDFKGFIDIIGTESAVFKAYLVEPSLMLQSLRIDDKTKASKDKLQYPWIRLKRLFQLESIEIKALLMYAIASGIMSLTMPLAVQSLVNIIAFGSLIQPLIVLSLVLLGLLILGSVIRLLQSYALEYLERKLFIELTIDFSRRLPRFDSTVDDHYRPTELVNRFFDISTIQKSMAIILLDGLDIFLQTILGLLLLAFYHPALLAFDILLILGILISLTISYRQALGEAIEESNLKYEIAAFFEDMVNAFTLFKTPHAIHYAHEHTQKLSNLFLKHRSQHFHAIFSQMFGLSVLQIVASVGLLSLGGYLVLQGTLSLGQLIAAELVVTIIVSGLTKLNRKVSTYYDLLASLEKLGKLVDCDLEPVFVAKELDGFKNGVEIELQNISFAPEIAGAWQGHRIDIKFPANQIIGIYAEEKTPSSPLLDTLFGLREIPAEGKIFVNGQQEVQRMLDMRNITQLIRYPEWISGTIEDNLVINQAFRDMNAIMDILKELGLWDDICGLSEGLQSQMDAQGDPLDVHQQAMLCIGRALLSHPKLLLIDHTLDILNLKKLEKVMNMLKKREITVIIVSQQPHALKYCHTIYQLKANGLHQFQAQA